MTRLLRIYLPLLVVLVGLSSCYNYRQVGFVQERDNLPHYDSVAFEEYRIRINDYIIFRIISLEENLTKMISENQGGGGSQTAMYYRVYPDGTIDIPFVEPVKIVGQTVAEAELTLRDALREVIPDADVKLALYNRTFTVIGELRSGVYPIDRDRLTIYEALALTGDLNNAGDRKHVRIVRQPDINASPEILEFDIRPNTLIDSKYYYIYPNDLIYVQRSRASFFKFGNYAGFIGLITSSLSLLVSVLSYAQIKK